MSGATGPAALQLAMHRMAEAEEPAMATPTTRWTAAQMATQTDARKTLAIYGRLVCSHGEWMCHAESMAQPHWVPGSKGSLRHLAVGPVGNLTSDPRHAAAGHVEARQHAVAFRERSLASKKARPAGNSRWEEGESTRLRYPPCLGGSRASSAAAAVEEEKGDSLLHSALISWEMKVSVSPRAHVRLRTQTGGPQAATNHPFRQRHLHA
jgi:hypothetical protein